MDIMTLISSTKAVVDLAKELKSISETIQQQELRAKVLGIIDEALNAKDQALELRMALQDKEAEIRSLQLELSYKKSMKFERGLYWVEGDQTPFCPTCYEGEQKMIHLILIKGCSGDEIFPAIPEKWRCRICQFSREAE